jgi:hypothetical protein
LWLSILHVKGLYIFCKYLKDRKEQGRYLHERPQNADYQIGVEFILRCLPKSKERDFWIVRFSIHRFVMCRVLCLCLFICKVPK